MQSPHVSWHIDNDSNDEAPEEAGVSLEELGEAYARLLASQKDSQVVVTPEAEKEAPAATEHDDAAADDALSDPASESDNCPVTPQSIVEAILFVGHPENQPATAEQIAALMRGVSTAEVEEAIQALNDAYRDAHHAMEIVASPTGYRLELAADLVGVRDAFYGKSRDAKLNQAAIDCLSLVAYQPGITRDELEKQWHQPSASILSMLVRRSLLALRREGTGQDAIVRYYPTERFLEVFGLNNLDELPQVQDFD